MLKLTEITKDYKVASTYVHALKGVSLRFRKSEFVCILGPSGCGKTTLLNIIGGLDHYTSGDLVIEGVSTKEYNDRDWDTYRNHSIGFIFQSYHLIPHQNILQNVELALTIAGVDKEERRRRAVEALERVGLSDKIKSLPNQLSGGQAQRVAIARALINDPEILLADEPTGALDSKTSVQIMELLKEIAKDRLVIMVTHNPELAEQYATRTIRLLDGTVVDDSMPYSEEEEAAERTAPVYAEAAASEEPGSAEAATEEPAAEVTGAKGKNKGKKKRSSMSPGMAFMLSLKNLLTKSRRTTMISIAGSIGIIGVSMVLAISAGVRSFIDDMQDDLLSGYPLSITETAIDFDSLTDFSDSSQKVEIEKLKDRVYVDSLLDTFMDLSQTMTVNTITPDYNDYVHAMPSSYYNAVRYDYGFDMSNYIYTDFTVDGTAEKTENVSITGIRAKYTSILNTVEDYEGFSSIISTVQSFREMPNNYDYILSQYDILASDLEGGKKTDLTEAELKDIFENKQSLVMVINRDEFSDLNFGQFGYFSEKEFLNLAYKAAEDPAFDESLLGDILTSGKAYDYFIGENAHSFKWYPNNSIYSRVQPGEVFPEILTAAAAQYKYNPTSENFNEGDGLDLKIRVILQKKAGISYGCLNSGLYYTQSLADYTRTTAAASDIVQFVDGISDDEEKKVLPVVPYVYDYVYYEDGEEKSAKASSAISSANGGMMSMIMSMGSTMTGGGSSTNINPANYFPPVDLSTLAGGKLPIAFYIYPLSFESKDLVTQYLDRWNEAAETETTFRWTDADGNARETALTSAERVKYTDTVGLIIAMVDTMIDIVTIALVSFTALALVVSTVMVGIITYVSVVERIKEIGILRAVGARKKDIKRLFNAETFIIGLAAGIIGIVITYLLSLILNLVVGALAGIYSIAALPWWQALIMIGVSVGLTLISGLIPASAAAKKDPVIALRTE